MNYRYYQWLFEEIEDKSKNLYVLVGPPGVGKSTWIKNNFSDKEYKTISRDEVIEKIIYPQYGLTAAELYSKNRTPEAVTALDDLNTIFQSIVMDALDKRPDNVIVDMMNADKMQRANILDRVKGKYPEYKLIAVKFEFEGNEDKVLQADIQRAKERSGERKAIDPEYIKWVMGRIKADPPTEAEGFDEIQSYNRFKEPEQMKEYNHKQFIDWLNGEKEKAEQEENNILLSEAKLSKYWKMRGATRAKRAKRNWPNAADKNWALKEQEKSKSMNGKLHKLFEKELESSEEMTDDAGEIIAKIKKEREKLKMQREAAKLMKPQEKLKHKKNLSTTYPPHKKGETVSGYYKKAAKKLGGVAAAAGETIGPAEE